MGAGDLDRTLGELLGKLEIIIPAFDSLEKFAGETSGDLKVAKSELRSLKEAVSQHTSKTEDKLEKGTAKFFQLENLLDSVTKAVKAIEKVQEKKSGKTWAVWLVVITGLVTSILTFIGAYILLVIKP